jgi:choline dehydrogenase-like flavoprotein
VQEVRGRVVLLCASTIETTRLLLHSADADWPEGLGNASGVLGRYLMDHPVTMAMGSAEGAGDAQPSRFGGAHSVCIPRFRNLGRLELAAPRGYGIWGGVQRGLDPTESGAVPVLFIIQGEMLPNRDNRVELDPEARDPWGVPVARITCAIGEQDELLLRDGLAFLDELGDAFGIEYAEASGQLRPPGLFVHEMGTARMGSERGSSFLDPWNRSWEIPNLFVCDGASFPASGWQNPTLTMMALTARCCDHIVQLCRRLEL